MSDRDNPLNGLLAQAYWCVLKNGKPDFFKLTQRLETKTFPEIIKEQVSQSYGELFLTVLALWLPQLQTGRAISFWSSSRATNDLRRLAELNIEIFGRGTTLSERLLNFAKNSKKEYVMLTISCEDASFGIVEENAANDHLPFTVGYIWNDLKPSSRYKDMRADILSAKTYSIIDMARILKMDFGAELEDQQHNALNKLLLKEKYLKDLFKAIKALKNPDENVKNEEVEVPLSQNFTVAISFMKFIQALAHFVPDINDQAQKVCAIGFLPNQNSTSQNSTNKTISFPSYGSAINLIGNSSMPFLKISDFHFLKSLYEILSQKIPKYQSTSNYDQLEGDIGLFQGAIKKLQK